MGKILSYSQFAKAIGVAPSTVSLMVKRGELKVSTDARGISGIDSDLIFEVVKKRVIKKYANNGILFINAVADGLQPSDVSSLKGYQNIADVDGLLKELISKDIDAMFEDEIITQQFLPMYKRNVLDEFMKRYTNAADTYLNKLVRDTPELGVLPYAELRDLVYKGKASNQEALEEQFKNAGVDIKDINLSMNETFASLINKLCIYWTDGTSVIKREDMSVDFFKHTSLEYNLIFYRKANNDKGYIDGLDNGKVFLLPMKGRNSDSEKILAVTQNKFLKDRHFSSVATQLEQGYFSIFEVHEHLSDELNEMLYQLINSGLYRKVVLNFVEADLEKYLPLNISRPLLEHFSRADIVFKDSHFSVE